MPYWNRDRDRSAEEFECYCDGCIPYYRPLTHELRGFDSREEYAASILGGQDHLIDLVLSNDWYADAYERYMTDEHRWNPEGYAWAPWKAGAACGTCGKLI